MITTDDRANALVSYGLGYSVLKRAGYMNGFTFMDWVRELQSLSQYFTTEIHLTAERMFGITLWHNNRGIISIRQSYIHSSNERRLWGILENVFRGSTKDMLVTWLAMSDRPYNIRGTIDVDLTKFSPDEIFAMRSYIQKMGLVFTDVHTRQQYAFMNSVDPLVFKMYQRDFDATRNLASIMDTISYADDVLLSLRNIINCDII